MAIRKIDIRLRLLPKPLMTRMLRLGDGRSLGGIIPRGKICVLPYVCNPRSAIYNPQSEKGGIAQLVERQLCKLEVRGSNPLASSLRSQRGGERRLSRRSLSEGGRFLVLPYRRGELRLGKPTQT